MNPSLLYVAACVLVPAAWGVIMYFLFEWLQARRRNKRLEERPPPIDYSI
ncbi:MAG: hypothetical protein R3B13_09415 [Polyangiaceae bacterium]